MRPQDFEQRTADYLGGEMKTADARAFETLLAENSVLAEEVQGLRNALDGLQTLDGVRPSRGAAAEITGAVCGPARPARRWAATLLRYAAVIVLAFGVGYFQGREGGSAPPVPVERATRRAAPPSGPDWEQRLAKAYARQSGRSGFARSLLTLAHVASSAGHEGQ